MAGKNISRIGDWVPQTQVLARARGGAAIYGELRQFDIDGSDAAVSGFVRGDETNVFGSVVPVDTAGLASYFPIGVCADPNGIADDAAGYWLLEGVGLVSCKDDDTAGADIDAGNYLIGTNGTSYCTGPTAASRALGIALEDAAAASDSDASQVDADAHRRMCMWWGGIPGKGFTSPA